MRWETSLLEIWKVLMLKKKIKILGFRFLILFQGMTWFWNKKISGNKAPNMYSFEKKLEFAKNKIKKNF